MKGEESLQKKVDTLALKRLSILSENNEKIPFTSLWEDQQVIIIFIRQFACFSCKAHVNKVWEQREKLKNKKIVFIGNGQPYIIKSFKEELGVQEAPIYTDPSLEAFEACGLNRGLRYLMNFSSLRDLAIAKKNGYKSNWTEEHGDKTQLGGIVAFKKPGILLYHFVSESLMDISDSGEWP
ncbi:MAG: AhpC/TSA family protein [Bdellovibrionota bacterium]|nr:AhpC/TSA family protein [Bdellovibrionota bacterium]